MFKFTTTSLINSDVDVTTGKDRWSSEKESDTKPASFTVLRVGTFYAPNVAAIYKAEASDPVFASATLDLSTLEDPQDGDGYRIVIKIGLTEGSSLSYYANDMWYKGLPLSIDFIWKGEASDMAERIVKIVKKHELNVYGKKILEFEASGDSIIITGTDEYQKFGYIAVEKFLPEAVHHMGDYVPAIIAAEETSPIWDGTNTITQGKEGFGTYSYLLHNLRLPTDANFRFLSPNRDEMPILGGKYNEYIIKYCVKRGVLGNSAVGETVESFTNHVFYVKEDLAESFENSLGNIAPEEGIVSVPE